MGPVRPLTPPSPVPPTAPPPPPDWPSKNTRNRVAQWEESRSEDGSRAKHQDCTPWGKYHWEGWREVLESIEYRGCDRPQLTNKELFCFWVDERELWYYFSEIFNTSQGSPGLQQAEASTSFWVGPLSAKELSTVLAGPTPNHQDQHQTTATKPGTAQIIIRARKRLLSINHISFIFSLAK